MNCIACKHSRTCTRVWRKSKKECPYFEQTTNADCIRSMTDEELCKLLMAVPDIPCNLKGYPESCKQKCAECITEWLKQPEEV